MIAKSNRDVRNLITDCKIAVCAHAQYRIGQNSPKQLARRRAASSFNAFAIATFCSLKLYLMCIENNRIISQSQLQPPYLCH